LDDVGRNSETYLGDQAIEASDEVLRLAAAAETLTLAAKL